MQTCFWCVGYPSGIPHADARAHSVNGARFLVVPRTITQLPEYSLLPGRHMEMYLKHRSWVPKRSMPPTLRVFPCWVSGDNDEMFGCGKPTKGLHWWHGVHELCIVILESLQGFVFKGISAGNASWHLADLYLAVDLVSYRKLTSALDISPCDIGNESSRPVRGVMVEVNSTCQMRIMIGHNPLRYLQYSLLLWTVPGNHRVIARAPLQ